MQKSSAPRQGVVNETKPVPWCRRWLCDAMFHVEHCTCGARRADSMTSPACGMLPGSPLRHSHRASERNFLETLPTFPLPHGSGSGIINARLLSAIRHPVVSLAIGCRRSRLGSANRASVQGHGMFDSCSARFVESPPLAGCCWGRPISVLIELLSIGPRRFCRHLKPAAGRALQK